MTHILNGLRHTQTVKPLTKTKRPLKHETEHGMRWEGVRGSPRHASRQAVLTDQRQGTGARELLAPHVRFVLLTRIYI